MSSSDKAAAIDESHEHDHEDEDSLTEHQIENAHDSDDEDDANDSGVESSDELLPDQVRVHRELRPESDASYEAKRDSTQHSESPTWHYKVIIFAMFVFILFMISVERSPKSYHPHPAPLAQQMADAVFLKLGAGIVIDDPSHIQCVGALCDKVNRPYEFLCFSHNPRPTGGDLVMDATRYHSVQNEDGSLKMSCYGVMKGPETCARSTLMFYQYDANDTSRDSNVRVDCSACSAESPLSCYVQYKITTRHLEDISKTAVIKSEYLTS